LPSDTTSLSFTCWQLNLNSETAQFPIPRELAASLFAVVWSGSVAISDEIAAECDGGTAGRWIGEVRPGAIIDLAGGDQAEIALMGVFGDEAPAFEASDALSHKGTLPCGDVTTEEPKALFRLLDVRDIKADPESWTQPSYILRATNGPTARSWRSFPGPWVEVPRPEGESGDPSLTVSSFGQDLYLGFMHERQQSEAVVCDIQLDQDPGGVGCTWRCKG
jgi:hypothetical protein